jgi:hypothetical protein
MYKSHPTVYNGVQFRSRLEARWACFFDLTNHQWQYEPYDLDGWTPDFCIKWYCGHSECRRDHILLVEVKPYRYLHEFEGHPCLRYLYGWDNDNPEKDIWFPADSSAAFGVDPSMIYFEMSHGAGGGGFHGLWIPDWLARDAWIEAGNKTQWRSPMNKRASQ